MTPPGQSRSLLVSWIVPMPCIGGEEGRTLTEKLTLAPILTTTPAPGKPVAEKGGAGIIGEPLKVRLELPLLVMVTVVLLLWLMNTLPKSTVAGLTVALGPAALPASVTVSMCPALRSVEMTRLAIKLPVSLGQKLTGKVSVPPPAGTDCGVGRVVNEVAFAPVKVSPVICRASSPLLVMVRFWVAAGQAPSWAGMVAEPKLSEEAEFL